MVGLALRQGFPKNMKHPKLQRHTHKNMYTNFNYIESPLTVCGATTQELRKLFVKMQMVNSKYVVAFLTENSTLN